MVPKSSTSCRSPKSRRAALDDLGPHLHLARHVERDPQRGTFLLVEQLRVVAGRGDVVQRIELCLRSVGGQELRRVLDPLVVGVVQAGHRADRELVDVARHLELVADRREHRVPAARERRTVQQHAVEVEQLAGGAARADGGHEVGELGVIDVAVRDIGHGAVSLPATCAAARGPVRRAKPAQALASCVPFSVSSRMRSYSGFGTSAAFGSPRSFRWTR